MKNSSILRKNVSNLPGYTEDVGNELLHNICNNPSKYREVGGSTFLNPKLDPEKHSLK